MHLVTVVAPRFIGDWFYW